MTCVSARPASALSDHGRSSSHSAQHENARSGAVWAQSSYRACSVIAQTAHSHAKMVSRSKRGVVRSPPSIAAVVLIWVAVAERRAAPSGDRPIAAPARRWSVSGWPARWSGKPSCRRRTDCPRRVPGHADRRRRIWGPGASASCPCGGADPEIDSGHPRGPAERERFM